MMYPLLLTASLHTKVWGGRKLQTVMGKPLPTADPYGEAWEVHDTAVVRNGALAGRTLAQVLAEHGAALIGAGDDPAAGFPLLVKILDAAEWLSIQVHPDDAQAATLEGQPRGKTEAWYILAADPGAKLIIGVEPGSDRAVIAQAIRDDALADHLVAVDVVPGDVLYIPAGTVHALGPGLMIYEIQQSSDTTYRLYDWGRMGLDGVPRPLHIEKGVQVANMDALPPITHPDDGTADAVLLVEGAFFKTMLHRGSHELNTEGRFFHTLTCIRGEAVIEAADEVVQMVRGESAVIPAAVGAYTLRCAGEVLRSWQAT